MVQIDLGDGDIRAVNQQLQKPSSQSAAFEIVNPMGAHALACGLTTSLDIRISGHVGYYCAGMNQQANITVKGNAGVGVAENMVSGRVHILGDASQSAGATGVGGLLVIDGNASSRCGIAMMSEI